MTAGNLARMTFLDPAARRGFTDWRSTAEAVVAGLRQAGGLDPRYARLNHLVTELTAASADFAALWSSHTVHGETRRHQKAHPSR